MSKRSRLDMYFLSKHLPEEISIKVVFSVDKDRHCPELPSPINSGETSLGTTGLQVFQRGSVASSLQGLQLHGSQSTTTTDSEALYLHLYKANEDYKHSRDNTGHPPHLPLLCSVTKHSNSCYTF